jgi:hypothetical protein
MRAILFPLTLWLLLLPAALAQNPAQHPEGKIPAVALHDPPHEGTSASRSGAELSDPDPLWKAYNAALEHVAVWRNEDVRKLKPLAVAPDGTVEVATATRYNVTSPLYGDTWVTIVPELLTICRQFKGDVALQVREVLGLPPNHEIPMIFVMKVQPSDIFRPTPDPTPWTLCPCGNPAGNQCTFDPHVQCGNSFPRDVAPSHVQWIANTTLSLRQTPGGFPWTHLGYTYNWKPGADSYGASEYIVRKGANVSDVKKFSLEEYCKP